MCEKGEELPRFAGWECSMGPVKTAPRAACKASQPVHFRKPGVASVGWKTENSNDPKVTVAFMTVEALSF
jgi:hypothetical protein